MYLLFSVCVLFLLIWLIAFVGCTVGLVADAGWWVLWCWCCVYWLVYLGSGFGGELVWWFWDYCLV